MPAVFFSSILPQPLFNNNESITIELAMIELAMIELAMIELVTIELVAMEPPLYCRYSDYFIIAIFPAITLVARIQL